MEFRVFRGNIVDVCTDAIVLPANTALKEGSGSSEAIFKAAGRKKLSDACAKIGHCDVGMSVVTPGFNLISKYIVHAVVPRWIDGNHDEYAYLSSAYLSALTAADVIKCESIAFPLLASGNNGFDLSLAFDIAKESIESFQPQYLNDVCIVLYGNSAVACAEKKGIVCNDLVVIADPMESRGDLRKERAARIIKDGAGIVADLALDVMEKGVEYFQKKENRLKILELGMGIAAAVLHNQKSK